MPTSSFGDRVKRKRAEMGLSLEQLGERLGVSNQAVHKWESGKSFPAADRLISLARALQTSVAYPLTGATELHNFSDGTLTDVTRYREGRSVPSYTPEQAIDEKSRPNNAPRVATHFSCSESAFQIPITNRANMPEFHAGDSVVIDPAEQPQPGDMVLAAVGDPATPFFAKFTRRSPSDVMLQPLNPDWPAQAFDASRDRIIGVMTEHTKPRRS